MAELSTNLRDTATSPTVDDVDMITWSVGSVESQSSQHRDVQTKPEVNCVTADSGKTTQRDECRTLRENSLHNVSALHYVT